MRSMHTTNILSVPVKHGNNSHMVKPRQECDNNAKIHAE